MTLALRHHHDRRIKAKTVRKIKDWKPVYWADLTPRNIGRLASKHMTCSCWMCRADKDERTNQKLNAQTELRLA